MGPVAATFQEVISERIELDLLVVGPSLERPHYTVVTSGMSALPMSPPADHAECRFAELVIALPLDWPLLDPERLADETHYWPLRWLKTLARFPHEFGTWLWFHHSVPNGDPPRPFAPGTSLCAWFLLDPLLLPPEACRLDGARDGEELHLFAPVAIHADELDLKLREGADALELRLRRAGATELVDPARPSVAAPGSDRSLAEG